MTDRPAVHTTRIDGESRTVVFLHGLFGQGRNFASIAKTLTPKYGVLLVDLPNHGASAWTDSVDYLAMADSVAEAIRAQCGDEQVALVGHSMGGKVAMVVALRHPDLIAELVVVDIAPDASEGASEFAYLLESLAKIDLEAVGRRSDADLALAEMVHSATLRGFLLQNLQRSEGGWGWKANLELLRRELRAVGEFPEGLEQHPYTGPVLWIAGANSDYVQPERHGEQMRALFPRVRRIVIKGAGHWVHSEQPDTFIITLRRFLDDSEKHHAANPA
ncbi:alpha/beta fold hydrolase [Epidermidibacterium keratini]|uniref:Alpha/beta fold hydrolase n=1 Tax=Epidermidibacterium keratini TaxID=1891644 RepID=A0A7L4YS69_9ACTN|nr:alpha/beta fold hydrolase [Epidermidibacterium keratini]QHC02016.1 alpha/beta fold hydrolase [Epidermidibacterium keratini]